MSVDKPLNKSRRMWTSVENEVGTRLINKKKKFFSESANFSASDRLRRNFPTVKMVKMALIN